MKKENAIAWRWYDRHTKKINELEEQITELTASSVTFEGVQVPEAYCVAQSAERKTVKCHSNKTSTDYIIHFSLYPDIKTKDVLKINNNDNIAYVVGKNRQYKIDRVYKYFNEDDPYERVNLIQ